MGTVDDYRRIDRLLSTAARPSTHCLIAELAKECMEDHHAELDDYNVGRASGKPVNYGEC
jgi:hypothetical protein